MSYLKELAAKDKEAREKAAAAVKEKEQKDKLEKENQEFFKQKTAYEITSVTGVQTCALPI